MSFKLTGESALYLRDAERHQGKLLEYAAFLVRVKEHEVVLDPSSSQESSRFFHIYFNCARALMYSQEVVRYYKTSSTWEIT